MLVDWYPKGGAFSWRVYRNWYNADRDPRELPYPGGRLGQPKWLDDDIDLFEMVRRFHQINGTLPDPAGLPRFDNA